MILAEDVLLMLTYDDTGKHMVDTTSLDLALAGALLLDLAAAGRVGVASPGEPVRAGRLVVRDTASLGDPVLDEALRRIAATRPKKPQDALSDLAKGLRPELLARLTARGILRAEEGRILGIFPTRSWPAADSAHEDHVRAGLHDVLVVGRTPTGREAGLVSLLHAVGALHKALGDVGVGRRELARRADDVARGGFADEAVRKAVQAVHAATTAALVATMAASTATAGGS